MAVFTVVDDKEFTDWLRQEFSFITVNSLTPIAEGIENTNYWFIADDKKYVFTIFELWDSTAVAYYIQLLKHLEKKSLPVCAPIAGRNKIAFWETKPAVIVPYAEGTSYSMPSEKICFTMGQTIARLHLAVADFQSSFPNPRGFMWRQKTALKVMPHLSAHQQKVLASTIKIDEEFRLQNLPAGACHCDLFRNNVLWVNDEINAVIDFYFGGYDILIFDLAVNICDWCFEECEKNELRFSWIRFQSILAGYQKERRLSDVEIQYFSKGLLVAALRFWLSRLDDVFYPRKAHRLTPHNPVHFEIILILITKLKPEIDTMLKQLH